MSTDPIEERVSDPFADWDRRLFDLGQRLAAAQTALDDALDLIADVRTSEAVRKALLATSAASSRGDIR